ncbi:hypothetical protein ACWD25_16575 [Streptomyces sp. NPDC002920]
MQSARRRRINETAQVRVFGRRVGRRSLLVTTGFALALAIGGTALAQTHQLGTHQVDRASLIIESRHQSILNP